MGIFTVCFVLLNFAFFNIECPRKLLSSLRALIQVSGFPPENYTPEKAAIFQNGGRLELKKCFKISLSILLVSMKKINLFYVDIQFPEVNSLANYLGQNICKLRQIIKTILNRAFKIFTTETFLRTSGKILRRFYVMFAARPKVISNNLLSCVC